MLWPHLRDNINNTQPFSIWREEWDFYKGPTVRFLLNFTYLGRVFDNKTIKNTETP